jgi:lipopolysaccharide export system permease protein
MMILLGLLAVVYLFDTVELLRRAGKQDDIAITTVLLMGAFKLPEVGQMVFPFAILFSGMLTFWQLTRRHELVIVRSAGLSVWQFITPILLTVFFIGVVKITLINPLGALMIGRYENLESEYLENQKSLISLSDQGLWLRQKHNDGMAVLHAEKIRMPEWQLQNVMVLFFSSDYHFQRRIDAPSSNLDPGVWTFNEAVINAPSQQPEKLDLVTLATELTIGELESSFASPETISFWKLPNYIQILEETGFNAISLKIYLQTLLSQPLLFMAMILLAATVSLRPARLRGTSTLIMSGVAIGFVIFFASSFMQALGGSQQIPVFIAAWFPAAIAFVLGMGALMALEDG